MATYWVLARAGFRRHGAYPVAAAAGVFTNVVFGVVRASVYLALFAAASGATIGRYDVVDAVTYAFVTQGLIMVAGGFSLNLDLPERIREGNVAIDLLRPVDFQGYWAAADAGRAVFHLLARGAPPILAGAVLFDLRFPTASAWPLFLLSCALAAGVGFGLRYLVALSGFWLLDTRGVEAASIFLGSFLAGLAVPLAFFPAWLRPIADLTPWAMTMQVPADIWLGLHTGFLVVQAAWLLALVAAGRIVTRRAIRRVVLQGG